MKEWTEAALEKHGKRLVRTMDGSLYVRLEYQNFINGEWVTQEMTDCKDFERCDAGLREAGMLITPWFDP